MTTATTTFASRVLQAAHATPAAGRFGGDKVFLHCVWAIGNFGREMSLEAFKGLLWDAHRAGLVELSRADMVEAMDPYDVRRSNMTTEMGATFNFLRIG